MVHRLLPALGLLLSSSVLAQDTTAPASTRYARPSLNRRLFIGSNYRDVWSQPVTARIFHLNRAHGGLTVKKLGGGQQTKSLQLEDRQGEKWVLRTIDKTVDKAMESEGIKNGFVRKVAQDMISAAQPYGAFTVAPMAKTLGVVTADPELVFVPDDPQLGEYREIFANTLCLLERREPTLQPGDAVEDTDKMLDDLKRKEKNYRFDSKMLLQARLLDMLIGDWDRHGGQWRWGYRKLAGDSVYIYPIPVDHDQAFFHSTGAVVPLVRPFTMKHLIGYHDEGKNMKTLNRKEWDFDKTLLGALTEADWQTSIQTFQQKLTDSVLSQAVRGLPPEVYAVHGEELFEKLQSRRASMSEDAMKYYQFLRKHEVKEPDAVKKEKAEEEKKEGLP